MNTKLSKEAIYYLSDALAKDIVNDTRNINASSISLNEFEKKANDIIHKLVVTKEINKAFLNAQKENKQ